MMTKGIFCNTDCDLAMSIPKMLVENIFGDSLKSEIEKRYNDMRNNFDLSYPEWQERFTTEGRPFNGYKDTTSICISANETKFRDVAECNTIGLDLPTWGNINSKQRTIMFIAQDPLRSHRWYSECNDIVVSSPFGIQDATHRKSRHGEVYYNIFSEIVKLGFGIYLTDAKKFYAKGDKSLFFTENNIERYKEILKTEINLVKPALIVTFGKQALSFVDSFVAKELILALIHPSGASRGHIKKKYSLNDCSNKRISELYVNEIMFAIKKIHN